MRRLLIALSLAALAVHSHAGEKQIRPQKSIDDYFEGNEVITDRQEFDNADGSQRVVAYCEDENRPGGSNEGASNPANVHCTAALFLNRAGTLVFSAALELGQGEVKKFDQSRLVIERLDYGDGDALCCPSQRTTQIFNTSRGTFVEDFEAEGDPPIVAAIKRHAPHDQLNALVSQGAAVDARDSEGNTALMVAAANNDLEAVEALLRFHADTNKRNVKGKTALMLSTQHIAVLRALLDARSDVNLRDKRGESVLHYAYNYSEALRAIVERGVNPDINIADADRTTILMKTLWWNRPTLQGDVEFLLLHGADPNLKDKYGRTALDTAKRQLTPLSHPVIRLLESKTKR
jgi:hypothetical protein